MRRPTLVPRRSRLGIWGTSGAALAVILLSGSIATASAQATRAGVAANQPLAILLHDHLARTEPNVHARVIEAVGARRPLSAVRTVLPVLGHAVDRAGRPWIHVRLPGRPNGHMGWIPTRQTRSTSTPWHLWVKLSIRRVTVYRDGHVQRRFPAVVGKPSTPTPTGHFFIEEALALSPQEPGAPFALASSARSQVLQEFDGGPGQIALHGTGNLPGALGTAASHGCVRLSTEAITWLAARIASGVPLTITR